MQNQEKKELEFNELIRLIGEGFSFKITYTINEKKWWQLWKKNNLKTV